MLRLAASSAAGILLMAAGALAGARTRSQEHQALGSLSSVGQVSVNNSAAPADATIFSGDVIHTAANATATFTSSAEGSFQIMAGSQGGGCGGGGDVGGG